MNWWQGWTRRVEDLASGPPKGPVLGPMVICGVSLSPENFEEMEVERVRDSKQIPPERRSELADFLQGIAKRIEFAEFSPPQIDSLRMNGTNLNRIEAIGFAQILNRLNPPKAYLDSASANCEKFANAVRERLDGEIELVVEHSADENYLPVSAASILAKVRRDWRIEELCKKHGETGSGYPSDERTIEFLKRWVENHRSLPGFARKTWKTVRRIKERKDK